MQKSIVIGLIAILTLGLLQPVLYMQPVNLYEVYQQCSHEDPDINPVDFVFEHLLNLEEFVSCFEHEDPNEENELPHQPIQIVHNAAQTFVAIPKRLEVRVQPRVELNAEIDHPLNKESLYFYNYHTDIFRPPIC